MTPRKPFEPDTTLQDWVRLMYEKTEEHSREITELRVCQAKKMTEIQKAIHEMKDEIKEEIGKHCQEQQTTCRYNHDKVDNAIAKKLPKWVFTTMLVITMAVFGWLVDTVVANKSYIDGHKVATKHIEEKAKQIQTTHKNTDISTYGILQGQEQVQQKK